MELKEILAIPGQPGLFKYVAHSRNGVIVESLLDGHRMNASSTSRVSALTEISMYTTEDDVPLAEVFTKMYEVSEGKEIVSVKDGEAKLREFFSKALPTYDEQRVHLSDIKKAISWFNILLKAGFTEFRLPDEENK
ncbi:MAG: DUF5606 domain-containing protein [Alistipes sp.]|nr:DUF5606 domain-containing protein [Candidatus Alistipes equi]